MPDQFESSGSKDLLRAGFDHRFIRRFISKDESEPTYFGLPGEQLLDVIEWRDCIEYAVCVHRSSEGVDRMRRSASAAGLTDRCSFYRSDIDTLLSEGRDESDLDLPERAFQVVNLDYQGGLLQDRNDSRLSAIRELFRRQAAFRRDFVLFLTLGPRGRPARKVDYGLEAMARTLGSYGWDATDTLAWIRRQPNSWQALKAFVPYILESQARAHQYELHTWQVFRYFGTQDVPMMHFAFHWTVSRESPAPDVRQVGEFFSAPLWIATNVISADPRAPPDPRRTSKKVSKAPTGGSTEL